MEISEINLKALEEALAEDMEEIVHKELEALRKRLEIEGCSEP
jgi:hypothetical protein